MRCSAFWRACEVRIGKNPRTTAAGLAAVFTIIFPQHADAILTICTMLIGLLSADAGATPGK